MTVLFQFHFVVQTCVLRSQREKHCIENRHGLSVGLSVRLAYTFQCVVARAVRRRRRPNVGVAPAPFSWRVHVMLYTSYMLLDCCNAVYNEAWTSTKSSRNDAGVFLHSPWYSNETRRRQSKSFFVDNFLKMISDAKSFIWNFFEIWFIKRMVQWKISTACTVITAYKVAKKRTKTLSARKICHNILNVW